MASNAIREPSDRGGLESLFHPQSVALIGGSRDPQSMGGTLLRNVCDSFQGRLHLVHPHAETLAGRPVWKSLAEIPEPIDLAIIAVPAAAVEATVEQCLAKPVQAIVLITAGFAELNETGRDAEARILRRVAERGVRLLGPNCLGVLNNDSSATLNATFSHGHPPAGDIGVCTQSGALGFVFPDYMRRWNLGVSQLVSLGNKADVGENDVLAYWSKTDGPRAIQVYLESFQDPRGFLAAVRPLARRRPVAVLLGGRTAAGSRAAGSHTAALASPDTLSRGLVRQAGGILVDSMVELFDVTALVAMQPLPKGRRVAVLTNAGGPGVLCADALEDHGLSVPTFSDSLQARLRALAPPQAAVANPVDLIGSTSPDLYAATLCELLASHEVDQIVVIYVPRLPHSSGPIATALRQTVAANTGVSNASVSHGSASNESVSNEVAADTSAANASVAKTVAAVFMEASGAPAELRDEMGGIPAFTFPENAAQALAAATRYAEWREREARDCAEPDARNDVALSEVDERARALRFPTTSNRLGKDPLRFGPPQRQPLARLQAGVDGWLPPSAVQSVLRESGLATPSWGLAATENEALKMADAIGWPVVAKAVADSVLHKARVGGVIIDIRTPTELSAAFHRLRKLAPDVRGVFLQAFTPGGRELFAGLRRDPRFGLVIGCGRGGTDVERLAKVAFRLLPATTNDLQSLIADAGIAEWLDDWHDHSLEERHCDRSEKQAVTETLSGSAKSAIRPAVARLVETLATIAALGESFVDLIEADFNPLSVRRGQAPIVLDARIRLRSGTVDG
ncbi:MAG: acetate--CoA ligase family protein [Planctomycetota bacterium]